MENWTEIKTAYLLGQLGTVSAAAETVGIHRATVIRRVESLERQLGGKLFQRHAKGYTPTELGRDLIRIAERSDADFRRLIVKARTRDDDLAGQFVLSCPDLVDHVVFSAAKAFKLKNPKIIVRYKSSNEVLKLEHGEADVAVTMGDPPDHPDYVVIPLLNMPVGLYCSDLNEQPLNHHETDGYGIRGRPFIVSERNFYGRFIEQWIEANVDPEQVVLTSSSIRGANDAVICGLGAGFLPSYLARRTHWLSEVLPSRPEWSVPLWIVTHVDLHRSAKVQSFLNFIKTAPEIDDCSTGLACRPGHFVKTSSQYRAVPGKLIAAVTGGEADTEGLRRYPHAPHP
ncbi:MAG: LysR family transcriptional regulator [Pseudomonadota bacterium]